jgi:hypothetical protein
MVLASVKTVPLNCMKLHRNPDCEMNLTSFMEVGQVDLYNLMGGFRTADKIEGMRKN